MQARTESILNGLSFQLATTTVVSAVPSAAVYGNIVDLSIISESSNPGLGSLTGTYSAYIVGGGYY